MLLHKAHLMASQGRAERPVLPRCMRSFGVPCAQVLFEGILLKPSMVTPGADSPKREKPEVVADYTLKLLKRRVPPAVPGAHLG